MSEIFSETFKEKLSFLSIVAGSFLLRLKTIAMVFQTYIFHDNVTGIDYVQFFSQNIVGCYQNRNQSQTFFVGIISSPKF